MITHDQQAAAPSLQELHRFAVYKPSRDLFWVPSSGWMPRQGVSPPPFCGMTEDAANAVVSACVEHHRANAEFKDPDFDPQELRIVELF
jgi:hypothetical protein